MAALEDTLRQKRHNERLKVTRILAVAVGLGYLHPADRGGSEIKFDQDCGLITQNPRVMTRIDCKHLRSRESRGAAVRIFDMNLAAS